MSDLSSGTETSNGRPWAKAIVAASLALLVLLVAFAVSGQTQAPAEGHSPAPSQSSAPSYAADIQPIFNKRCVACHGCIASPCNLKLTSFRAAQRGALGKNPYSSHLETYARTDMDLVQTTAE